MRGRLNLAWLLGVLVVVIGIGSSMDARAADGDVIWDGVIQVPGVELGFSLTLTPAGEDGWSGALSIPMQGLDGAVVSELVVSETGLDFILALPGMPEGSIPRFDLEIDESGAKASGLMTQAGATFPVTLEIQSAEEAAAAAAALRPQTPVGPFVYRTVEVKVPVAVEDGEGHTLAGTLVLPEAGEFGDGPYACAVFLTGSGPQDRDEMIFGHRPFAVIADALAKAGVASLRCDERGIGESTGDFALAASHEFAADALAQVGFARERAEIDAGRVGLIGHSEGGLTAAIVAADNADVAFVVSLAGMGLTGRETLIGQSAAAMRLGGAPEAFIARNSELAGLLYDAVGAGAPYEEQLAAMRELVLHQMGMQAMGLPEDELAELVRGFMAPMDTAWMHVLLTIDPADYLRRVRQPVLVMNGELDIQVLPDTNLEAITAALDAAGNEDVTVHRLPGLNHLFQNAETGAMEEYAAIRETFDPAALRIVVDWVVSKNGR